MWNWAHLANKYIFLDNNKINVTQIWNKSKMTVVHKLVISVYLALVSMCIDLYEIWRLYDQQCRHLQEKGERLPFKKRYLIFPVHLYARCKVSMTKPLARRAIHKKCQWRHQTTTHDGQFMLTLAFWQCLHWLFDKLYVPKTLMLTKYYGW